MKKFFISFFVLMLLFICPRIGIAESGSYLDTLYQVGQEGENKYQNECSENICEPDRTIASDGKCVGEDCSAINNGTCVGNDCASNTCSPDNCPDGECVDGKCVVSPEKKLKAILGKIRGILNKLLRLLTGKIGGAEVSINVIPEKPTVKPEPKPAVEPEPVSEPEPAVEPEPTPEPETAVDPEPIYEPSTTNKYVQHDNFEAAKKAAKEKGHPIMMVFSGSDWCGWCKKFDSEVIAQPEFQDYAKDNMETFVADYPRNSPQSAELKTQNKALLAEYGVSGFPTVLIVTAEGKVIKKTGYIQGGAANYVKHLKTIIK